MSMASCWVVAVQKWGLGECGWERGSWGPGASAVNTGRRERGPREEGSRSRAPWTRDLDTEEALGKAGGFHQGARLVVQNLKLCFLLVELVLVPDEESSFFSFFLLNPISVHREMPDGGGPCLPQSNAPSKSCQHSLPRKNLTDCLLGRVQLTGRRAHTHTHTPFC